MYFQVADFRSRPAVTLALALGASLLAACGSDGADLVSVGDAPDASLQDSGVSTRTACDRVEVDGELVLEHETHFTARFRAGEPYTKTLMLFGGEPVEEADIFGNAYVLGLDKADALTLAEQYPDFYLCSSPGGQAAADLVLAYDLVPASCEVYEQLVAALRQFDINRTAGGDRTSIRFEGAPLELESVIDANGQDVTDQVSGQDFHLVTAVEQLTGESVLSFGTTN
jgi:hypothetical protein